MWDKDSPLLQIPHFTEEAVKKCQTMTPPVETVFDVLDLDDDVRTDLMSGFAPHQVSDIAVFCNSYPNIELSFEKDFEDEVTSGDSLSLVVQLQREVDDEDEDEAGNPVNRVVSSRYPYEKLEGWWLVVGDSNNNTLLV